MGGLRDPGGVGWPSPWFFARIKSIYGTDTLLTKIASGATTGALGAFLANPVVPGREHGKNHGANKDQLEIFYMEGWMNLYKLAKVYGFAEIAIGYFEGFLDTFRCVDCSCIPGLFVGEGVE